MTTFAYALAAEMAGRFNELNEIVRRAKAAFDVDPALYDILCRGGSVLVVSAVEAFLKDINVAIQSDLNIGLATFADMPKKMQRQFSDKIVFFDNVPEAELNRRSTQLIKYFHSNSVNIDMSAFPYKESLNKNPSANMVDSSFSRYGINSVLHCLGGSKFEAVFDNDSATDMVLRREIKRMRGGLYKFPYQDLPPKFKVRDWVPVKGQTVPASLWHAFLEHILGRRHAVVHADTRGNPTSWQAIEDDVSKLDILFHGVLLAATSLIGSDLFN